MPALTAKIFAGTLLVLVFSGCSRIQDPTDNESLNHSLTISFSGMSLYQNLLFQLKVISKEGGPALTDTSFSFPSGGALTLSLGEILSGSESYRIDFYADLSRNGDYDAPPRDHAWRRLLLGVSDDIALDFTPGKDFSDIDLTPKPRHDFSFRLIDFDTLANKRLGLRVVDSIYGTPLLDTAFFVPDTNLIALSAAGLLVAGRAYLIDIFADLSGNLAYNPPPADAAWRIPVSAVHGAVSQSLAFNTLYTAVNFPADSIFDFSLTLQGMDAELNKLFHIKLIDTLSRIVAGETRLTRISASQFVLTHPEALVRGRNYWADFYIDQNQNGNFDTLPIDKMWRVPLYRADRDTALVFTADTHYTAIDFVPEPVYRLTLRLREMVPHLGKMMAFQVIDNQWGQTIADTLLRSVTQSEFLVDFGPAMVKGLDYNIEFYVDANTNFTYNFPGDYVWRLSLLEADADDTLDFVHNVTFTPGITFAPTPKESLGVRFFDIPSPLDTAQWQIKVVDIITGAMIGDTLLTGIPTTPFPFGFGDLLVTGRFYQLDFFADLNGNGANDYPAEPSWRRIFTAAPTVSEVDFFYDQDYVDIR